MIAEQITMEVSNKTKPCVHCGKVMNEKYMACPHCGGQQQEIFEPLPPECPRCEVSLNVLAGDGEEYDVCPQCGGMWLDKDEFHRATRERDVYKDVEIRGEYLKAPARGPVEYIPCVRCGKLMNRKNFGKVSGVMIDRCGKHGVWLDAGELEKIRHFIADGGLDRSRDMDIAMNREKIRELAVTVGETAFTQRLLHFWNFKRWLFRGC